nr:immunoglobulin heavy chain junction region [Mus musculus]MBK4185236.1 immunoglobulin heavy chain junction region [Mus musculus]MBK4185237.1 immunoglobulin heavy chain junction region [Mus musculus]MBK4185238.1 immunoglobulin heavy chain junction region [Mus musculus]
CARKGDYDYPFDYW